MYEPLLHKAGLKITGPRLKILALLHTPSKRHWSAEAMRQALQAQDEDIGLATVYRALTQFEKHGLTKRHLFENDVSVFELNEAEHHDHLVCITCGAIVEFFDETIEQHQENIAIRSKFKMLDHRLIIYGLCFLCQQASQEQ
jgi:Fur family ferric uptake transcriptional regulator